MISGLVALAGTVLGWWLSRRTAREERDWREAQTIREREEAMAQELRRAVIDVQRATPQGVVAKAEGREGLAAAHTKLREAWTEASLLRNEDVDRAYYAVDMTFMLAGQDVTRLELNGEVNLWPLSRGIIELRKALDAYLRRVPISELHFPSSEEQVQLLRDHRGYGLEAITDWMMERNFTSFR